MSVRMGTMEPGLQNARRAGPTRDMNAERHTRSGGDKHSTCVRRACLTVTATRTPRRARLRPAPLCTAAPRARPLPRRRRQAPAADAPRAGGRSALHGTWARQQRQQSDVDSTAQRGLPRTVRGLGPALQPLQPLLGRGICSGRADAQRVTQPRVERLALVAQRGHVVAALDAAHQARHVVVCHAGADDEHALVAQRRQRPPHGDVRGGRHAAQQRQLRGGHVRLRERHLQRHESAVVVAALRVCSRWVSAQPARCCAGAFVRGRAAHLWRWQCRLRTAARRRGRRGRSRRARAS